MEFGPDGRLYIGKGDAGWEGDPLDAGQNLNTQLSKLLRIDVDTADNVAYAVPDDNPFANASKDRMTMNASRRTRSCASSPMCDR